MLLLKLDQKLWNLTLSRMPSTSNLLTHAAFLRSKLIPVQAATGGRSGVSVYKAGRSVPLDSAQLDLSRLALPQLGSAGVEKCFEIHVPSSGLKTNKKQKRSKNTFHE